MWLPKLSWPLPPSWQNGKESRSLYGRFLRIRIGSGRGLFCPHSIGQGQSHGQAQLHGSLGKVAWLWMWEEKEIGLVNRGQSPPQLSLLVTKFLFDSSLTFPLIPPRRRHFRSYSVNASWSLFRISGWYTVFSTSEWGSSCFCDLWIKKEEYLPSSSLSQFSVVEQRQHKSTKNSHLEQDKIGSVQ